jgi:myo-inositol 2-dehydrogenase / D-chiro-inositol 1-dehydrogenase
MNHRPRGVLLVTGGHSHQEIYAPLFAADRRCRIVAVADEAGITSSEHEKNAALARSLGVPYLACLKQALTNPEIDLVSVCAPPERRCRVAIVCAEAGKHLYLDKSLAPTLAGADDLVGAVRRTGVRSHMFSFITQPWARRAKQVLAEGRLGRLLAMHAEVLFAKGHAGSARLGQPRREEYPPGRQQGAMTKRELDNTGVYAVTLLAWLAGREFRTVYGVTANYFFEEHQKEDVEDFGHLAGTLADDIPVTATAGRIGWTSYPAYAICRVLLIGSQRSLLADACRPRLEVWTDERPWQPPSRHPGDPMGFWISTQAEVGFQPKPNWLPVMPSGGSDVSYFLDCLDAGRDSEMSVVEAAHAAEVLLAAYRSAASGEVTSIPLER